MATTYEILLLWRSFLSETGLESQHRQAKSTKPLPSVGEVGELANREGGERYNREARLKRLLSKR
jgi:hypothetical protein